MWDPSTATFYLRNSNTSGGPDVQVRFGASSYVPLVGDWNGDGKDTIGRVGSVDGDVLSAEQQHAGSA